MRPLVRTRWAATWLAAALLLLAPLGRTPRCGNAGEAPGCCMRIAGDRAARADHDCCGGERTPAQPRRECHCLDDAPVPLPPADETPHAGPAVAVAVDAPRHRARPRPIDAPRPAPAPRARTGPPLHVWFAVWLI